MYSFSTCWNSHRHTDGRAMLHEIRKLGFSHAELSHGIRLGLVPGILDAVEAGEIKISSVHNFCPLPLGVNKPAPNLYQFSARDSEERERALKHTFKTFDFAARVGAPLVVLHLGSMELKDYGSKLEGMIEEGKGETPSYRKLLLEAVNRRESKKIEAMERLYETFKKIVPEATQRGLRLGCENREGLAEIPLDTDFQGFLKDFGEPSVAYWHDCGHAQIKQNFGIIRQETLIEPLVERLAGWHIHDVQYPATDHCPPGTGNIDFAGLVRHVRPDHIKVFEISPRAPVEAIRTGVAHLKSLWGAE